MIENNSDRDIALVSASSEQAVRVELHTHEMANGVMSMKKLEQVIVPTGGTLEFKPGSHHLMLFGLYDRATGLKGVPVVLEFDENLKMQIFLTKEK